MNDECGAVRVEQAFERQPGRHGFHDVSIRPIGREIHEVTRMRPLWVLKTVLARCRIEMSASTREWRLALSCFVHVKAMFTTRNRSRRNADADAVVLLEQRCGSHPVAGCVVQIRACARRGLTGLTTTRAEQRYQRDALHRKCR